MAARAAAGLAALGNRGVALVHPVEANELFVRLPETVRSGLEADGFLFHGWGPADAGVVRLVTAWNTDPADVAQLVARCRAPCRRRTRGLIWIAPGAITCGSGLVPIV